MSLPSRAGAVALLAASLAGCQALGGGAGVMPASDVGPPPSLRGSLPGRDVRPTTVDPDGAPLQTEPTRRLDLPKTARGEARGSATAERRIRRDELEGSTSGSGGSSDGITPQMGAGGSMGIGGKF